MINILIPMAGKKSNYFNKPEFPFPTPLVEIGRKTMIEHALVRFQAMEREKRFIFIIDTSESQKFHTDNVLRIVAQGNCEIVKLRSSTKGAACSCLMAISHINNDEPLIIANYDQVLDVSIDSILNDFLEKGLDAGVLTFEAVHPRWSFVDVDEKGLCREAAEKRPISSQAIAGFYFFRRGRDFVDAAMRSILKGAEVQGAYFIAPCLNELILLNMKVGTYKIPNEQYHTLYTPQKLQDFEKILQSRGEN